MALELVLAPKGLLSSGILQDNIELPRTWTVPSKHIPNQVIIDHCRLVYHASRMKWADYEVWAQFWSLRMFGPRPKAQWAWDHTPYNNNNNDMLKKLFMDDKIEYAPNF